MITKSKVIDSMKDLPEEFLVEDLIERLIFIQKVEEGLSQSQNGETVSIEEAKKRLSKWLQ